MIHKRDLHQDVAEASVVAEIRGEDRGAEENTAG